MSKIADARRRGRSLMKLLIGRRFWWSEEEFPRDMTPEKMKTGLVSCLDPDPKFSCWHHMPTLGT